MDRTLLDWFIRPASRMTTLSDAELAASGVEVEHYFVDDDRLYIKRTKIRAGLELAQHVHDHDHAAILAAGVAELVVDGVVTRLEAPAYPVLKAGAQHTVRAVTDIVWHCIWLNPTRETDPARIDAALLGG